MAFWYPPEGAKSDPRWWRVLEEVIELTRQSETLPAIAACEFMFMGVERRHRGRIWLYKHTETRCYLNLDDAGHAYRYVPPRDEMRGSGRYVPHRRLLDALKHLELGILDIEWREDLCRGCDVCEGTLRAAQIDVAAKMD